jgi:hypothetical protein
MLTGERLVVFLFAARVALAAPAYLASPLVVLAAAALAVDGSASAASGPGAPLPFSFYASAVWVALVIRVVNLVIFDPPPREPWSAL